MISKIKNKVKFVLSDEKAYINTPTVLVGMLILIFIVLLFTDAVVLSSQGFQARQAASTVAKQISVAGEINENTANLAKELCYEMMADSGTFAEKEKGRMIVIQITDSSGNEIQSFGYTVAMDEKTEDFTLANKTTEKNGKTIPMYKFQLGDTAKVNVMIYNTATTTGVIEGNLFNPSRSVINVKSTAVSQIYWKELDV